MSVTRAATVTIALISACGRLHFTAEPDAATAADVAADVAADAPPDALPCGSPSELADPFPGGAISPAWVAAMDPGVTVSEGGGELTITLVDSTTQTGSGSYSSRCSYDFTSDRLAAEIDTLPASSTFAEMYLALVGTNTVGFDIKANSLIAYTSIAATFAIVDLVPFDPGADRHVQLRFAAGTTFWETSPDGTTWTTLISEPSPVDVSSARALLAADTYMPVTAPGQAAFGPVDLP